MSRAGTRCVTGTPQRTVFASTQAPAAQQGRRTVHRLDLGMVEQAQAQAVRHDLDAVADLQAQQHLGREVDDHMIDAAVLAGHQADLPRRRPADHPGPVAHTRIGDQGVVGAIPRTDDLPTVVVQGHAGLDVVAGQTDAEVADPAIEHDAAGAWQDARHAVVTHAVRGRAGDGMGHLPLHGHGDQFVGVDRRRGCESLDARHVGLRSGHAAVGAMTRWFCGTPWFRRFTVARNRLLDLTVAGLVRRAAHRVPELDDVR